jgi:steroid delta-isomerase-like uncharacterized protein
MERKATMSPEENKALVHRFVEEVFNRKEFDVLDELLASDFVNHSAPPGIPPTRAGYKQFLSMYLSAFPDLQIQIEDQIAEEDRVVIRFTAHGTHKSELMGIPASGKEVTFSGINISRIGGGKVRERWEEVDMMGLMQQLGVVPPPGESGE